MPHNFKCREKCGACCIVPSISSFIPGMPNGKPAGTRCIHLADDMKCGLFGKSSRPRVCAGFQAEELVCGTNRDEAIQILADLEGINIASFAQNLFFKDSADCTLSSEDSNIKQNPTQ